MSNQGLYSWGFLLIVVGVFGVSYGAKLLTGFGGYAKTIEVEVKNYDDHQICGLQSGEGMRFEISQAVYASLQSGTERLLSHDARMNHTIPGETFDVKNGCVTMSLTRIEQFRVSANATLKEPKIVRIKFYK